MSVSISLEPIRVALFDWLHASVNSDGAGLTLAEGDANAIPVIRAEDDQVRPNRLFIEYKFLTGFNKIGERDQLRYSESDGSFKLKGEREFTVTVNIVGVNAADCAAQIVSCMESPAICDGLRSAGLATRNQLTVADASVFQETDFEERAVLDVVFGVALEKLDPVTFIELVKFTNGLPGGEDFQVDLVDP